MHNLERNKSLLEQYKKKSYEELKELEADTTLTENDSIIVSIAKNEKELIDGIENGKPMEFVFGELLKQISIEKNNYERKSNRRVNSY